MSLAITVGGVLILMVLEDLLVFVLFRRKRTGGRKISPVLDCSRRERIIWPK
jgi:hypothetical protein